MMPGRRLIRWCGVVCVWLGLGGGFVHAGTPVLADVQPTGGVRGAEVAVVFSGDRLADAQEILIYEPGITVTNLTVESPQQVKVMLQIAADCPLGEHAFRVRAVSGVTELRTFWVGPFPVIGETEPNSEFATPQPVSLNTTITGVITGEDVDYFVVDCKKGQRLSAEIEGMRLGRQFWDPYLAILDEKRFEIAASDDTPGLGQDAACSVLIPADGKYFVQVREASYGGNPACHYRLHVGTFPRPKTVVPAGGKPGEEVEFRFTGDPLGEIVQKMKLPAVPGEHRVHVQTADGVHPAGIKVRVRDLPGVIAASINTPETAVVGAAPGAFHGIVDQPEAGVFFRFTGKKGQTFDATVYARRLGSPLDPVLHLYAANGNALGGEIAVNDDSDGTPDSFFRATLPEDGDYFVRIYDHLQKGGPDYFFRIEFASPRVETVTNLPKVDGNNVANQARQNVVVPQGGRGAVLVNADRANWGGPAALGFSALPAGVSFQADTIDPSVVQVPVVFEATPDAAPSGVLAEFRATPTDPNTAALARTNLDVNYNLAINNTPFHRYFADRVAVVAAEPCPFSVDVVEPTAPVPQNGSLDLKVVVKRKPGFANPVHVYPLWMPPGIGIQGSVSLDGNTSEATMSVNAAANSPVKTWKTALIALGDEGKGEIWTSSQLFTLSVGPPVLTLTQERAAVEQGQSTQVVCKVEVAESLDAPATVRLVGLPAGTTAAEKPLAADTKEIVFDVATDKTTPAGKHGVFCQVVATRNGQVVNQSVGGAELRVDVPLPAPVAAKPAEPTPAPAAADKPPEKRLSRLEKLRQEQEAREKEAREKAPVPPPAPKGG